MELKYVGPKPIISHSGIDFDNNKEDKFIYLNITLQLLRALDHEYIENKTYTYHVDTDRYSNDELLKNLKHYCPDISAKMEIQNHSIEDEIQHNIDRANENTVLSPESKEALKNNIEMMHDYLVQRSINKTVYYSAIEALTELVKKDNINHIVAPMYQSFTHVLHSVQGVLTKQKFPINSKMEIYQEDGKLLVNLLVENL